ncbi:hypothetical protein M8J76_007847 [Diaphorina citri]|nr:hypothetical protein M8J75_009873 [Diaphorina citri]KAI5722401.1 hypothetical protein M8J76_007847 [Diaphorina citri]
MSDSEQSSVCAEDCDLTTNDFLSKLVCGVEGCRKILPIAYCQNYHVLCKYHSYMGYCPKCLDTRIEWFGREDMMVLVQTCRYLYENKVTDKKGNLLPGHLDGGLSLANNSSVNISQSKLKSSLEKLLQ